jgi:spore germination protein YaaH
LRRLTISALAWAFAAATTATAAPATGPDVVFHVPWDAVARAELPLRLGAGRTFAPLWISLTDGGGTLSVSDDPAASAPTLRGARVMPLVTNAHDGIWDSAAATALFADTPAQARVAARLADLAARRGWAGYIFDFEALPPDAMAAYPAFVGEMRRALARRGKSVWVTALLSADPAAQKSLQDASDQLVLMAYDECWATSTPGPVAGEDWLETLLAQRLAGLDPRRITLGLAAYAYDWPQGGAASIRTVPEALALARAHDVAVVRDLATANATFDYTVAGVRHTVWIADATAYAFAAGAGRRAGIRRIALWRLGLEEPALWTTTAAAVPYRKPTDPPPTLPRCFLLPH